MLAELYNLTALRGIGQGGLTQFILYEALDRRVCGTVQSTNAAGRSWLLQTCASSASGMAAYRDTGIVNKECSATNIFASHKSAS